MTIRATQSISSAFGTYRPGDPIDTEAAGVVIPAWLAAGIVEDVPEGKPEKATRTAPEKATMPRPEEHPRFVQDASKPTPQRRFNQNTGSPRGS